MKNKYCDSKDLRNEASVESCFVDRLLRDLGYADSEIDFKTSIQEYAIGIGGKRILYKPDYILKINGIPTVVIDAKSSEEDISNWEFQCSAYCLELNRLFDYNPVSMFVLTNGLLLNVYAWDAKAPLLSLRFEHFNKSAAEFSSLVSLIGRQSIKNLAAKTREEIESKLFLFAPVGLRELNEKFQKLHKYIWRTEKRVRVPHSKNS